MQETNSCILYRGGQHVLYTVQREAAEYYVNRVPSTEDVSSVLYGEDFQTSEANSVYAEKGYCSVLQKIG